MYAKEVLEKDRYLIDKHLYGYLNRAKGQPKEILKAMNYAVFPGGKRLRPVLCLEACRACGGDIKEAVSTACAIEFVHNFSLIHDDLPSLDNDDFRRGKPTTHRFFGEAIALLAGDALLNLAYGIISGIKNKNVSCKTAGLISQSIGLKGMIGGQSLDIVYRKKRLTKPVQSEINNLKTASLFSAALASGAIASRAGTDKIKMLYRFGRSFGKAFQIYDDIKDKKYEKKMLKIQKAEFKRIIRRAENCLDIFADKADNLKYILKKLENKVSI